MAGEGERKGEGLQQFLLSTTLVKGALLSLSFFPFFTLMQLHQNKGHTNWVASEDQIY
jgi:hypothetical protein